MSILFPSCFLQQQTTDAVLSISFSLAADHRCCLIHLVFFSSRPLMLSRPPHFLLQQTTNSISSILFPSRFLQQQTTNSISFSSAADHQLHLIFFSSRPPTPSHFLQQQITDTILSIDFLSLTPMSTVLLPERCYSMDVYSGMVVGTAEHHIQIFNLTNPTVAYKVSHVPLCAEQLN